MSFLVDIADNITYTIDNMMPIIRLIYKLSFFMFSSILLVVISGFITVGVFHKKYKYKLIAYLTYVLLKLITKVFGFKIKVIGQENIQPGKNYLIACNHMGYMDIAVIQSVFKNNFFITHNEITEKYMWLSFLPKMAGTYFIERRNMKNLRTEIRDTVNILKRGSHLVLFPEGTSTDGSGILPFHAPFFLTAIRAKKDVLPICLNYVSINNEPINSTNKRFVCWTTKDITFLSHFCGMLRNIYSISVNVTISLPLTSKDKTSRELATESEKRIKQHFKIIT